MQPPEKTSLTASEILCSYASLVRKQRSAAQPGLAGSSYGLQPLQQSIVWRLRLGRPVGPCDRARDSWWPGYAAKRGRGGGGRENVKDVTLHQPRAAILLTVNARRRRRGVGVGVPYVWSRGRAWCDGSVTPGRGTASTARQVWEQGKCPTISKQPGLMRSLRDIDRAFLEPPSHAQRAQTSFL